jgi:hypothetical protein
MKPTEAQILHAEYRAALSASQTAKGRVKNAIRAAQTAARMEADAKRRYDVAAFHDAARRVAKRWDAEITELEKIVEPEPHRVVADARDRLKRGTSTDRDADLKIEEEFFAKVHRHQATETALCCLYSAGIVKGFTRE